MSTNSEKKDKDNEAAISQGIPTRGSAVQTELVAHVGVKRVEAVQKVWGKHSKWVLYISLGFASYVFSLNSQTGVYYLTYAVSALGHYSMVSTLGVVESVIVAVGKPVIAKLADVTSRTYAYLGILLLYTVGSVLLASAPNIGVLTTGIIIASVGYTGLQLLIYVIVADLTTLRWRTFASALTGFPYVVNAYVSANIAGEIVTHSTWRWGYGMFAILMPVTLLPLTFTLFWGERKAKRLGIIDQELTVDGVPQETLMKVPQSNKTILERARLAFDQLDLVGLILIGAAVTLILLPLTLANNAHGGWKNASMIAMIVVGGVLLIVFGLWEAYFAKYPVIPSRFLKNRSVVLAILIKFLDNASFNIITVYLYTFILVVKPWTIKEANYFMETQFVALTLFGVIVGAAMLYVRRFKPFLIIGLVIRLIGCGLMIHSRGANGSTVEIVWTQVLQGIGGGLALIPSQTAAQAGVSHADVATVTAAYLLWSDIGGGVGSGVAGAIWSNTMLNNIRKELPNMPDEQLQQLYESIVSVAMFPRGNPIREGVIRAYDSTMKDMTIVATAIAVVPVILSIFIPNWYLGDEQNATEDTEAIRDGTMPNDRD